jgi:hypothetical protein
VPDDALMRWENEGGAIVSAGDADDRLRPKATESSRIRADPRARDDVSVHIDAGSEDTSRPLDAIAA